MTENICEYCGQALMPGQNCDCMPAQEARRLKAQIEEGKIVIKDILKDVADFPEETIFIAEQAVESVAREELDKVTLVLPGGSKLKISKKDSSLKIECVETIRSSAEVNK